jgi:hypothetical protein
VDFELKFRESLGFKFEENLLEFLLGTSNWDETWTRYFYFHLVTHSTHDEKFEVQTWNFMT